MEQETPLIVCLCGSTRFSIAFQQANLNETLAGHIVLSIGCNMRDGDVSEQTEVERARIKRVLDNLHRQKIDLADEILVLNVGGYIGFSTASEIAHAQSTGKHIRFLKPNNNPLYVCQCAACIQARNAHE